MALEILTGLPGSGKSARLIERVNAATQRGRKVVTFACSESPWLCASPYVRVGRMLGCRVPGLTCRLDHFAPTAEAARLLDALPSGTLAAFDEAHYFAPDIAPHWASAARRGLEVLVAMPSEPQLARLIEADVARTHLAVTCQQCGMANAAGFIVVPGEDRTLSLCPPCDSALTTAARAEIVERLERQPPYPGETTIYQPVGLAECADWKVLRTDSAKRVELMTRVVRSLGLPGERPNGRATYLDVACNTGYFCRAFRELGFYSEGVDLVEGDIAVARLLDSYIARGHGRYVVADAYDYLRDTNDCPVDVASAFSVFQWVMIQTTVARGVECIERLFAKTRQVCFLEMGYSEEGHYRGKIGVEIDRPWVRDVMAKGGFSRVEMFDAKEHGLWRDLFVGVRMPKTTVLVPELPSATANQATQARVVAFYLPQFHPIAENDEWWGTGFTEWTNVAKAGPLFAGHYQPHRPAHLGYYDLRVPEARAAQAALAGRHGVEAFCYWHYWFGGRRLLERPFDEVLKSGEPDFPFCLAWANETWSRRWLGEEKEILLKQTYPPGDDRLHARWLAAAFRDRRYLRVDGRPLFLVYRPLDLPDPRATIAAIREEAARTGGADPYLVGIASHQRADFRACGFDANLVFEPQLGIVEKPLGDGLKVCDYADARRRMARATPDYPAIPCVMVSWDNTPRRGEHGVVFTDATPAAFETGLREAVAAVQTQPPQSRLVFVNAWNEWAEGNHLEPDERHGLAYLEAVRRAVGR